MYIYYIYIYILILHALQYLSKFQMYWKTPLIFKIMLPKYLFLLCFLRLKLPLMRLHYFLQKSL